MNRIWTSAFSFRPEHCKHHPGVFFRPRGEQRKEQLHHVPRCCRVWQPSLGSPRANPHGLGWNWVIFKVPFIPNHSGVPQGPAPAHQGMAHLGFGDWFHYGFHGGQTDRQTLTLLTAVAKQTKEISLEIEVILKFTSKKPSLTWLLPFIWLTAHENGISSSEIRPS